MTPEVENGKCKSCGCAIMKCEGKWRHENLGVTCEAEVIEPAPPQAPKDGSGTKPNPSHWITSMMDNTFNRIDFEKYIMAVRKSIDMREFNAAINMSYFLEHMTKQMVLEMRATLLSKSHKERVEEKTREITLTLREAVEVPSSWWQHFKFEWFPSWALEQWPVKMRKIYVERWEKIPIHLVENHIVKICPHLNPRNLNSHVAWMASDSKNDEFEERKESYRLKSFIMRLVRDDYQDGLKYECSNRVIEEAKKALEG